ncbi:hypothetical protein [Bariatricus sp. SGI.019]|uniref:hypothetical protein n=1 Tax=Bariatricus sp. SGI.019 TaxID=3420548 RepID=UPI003D0098A3
MAEYISKFNTSEGAKQVDYNALGNLPSIPSKTSDLQNDSGFLTEHQDLSGYATKDEIPKTASEVGADAAGTAESKVSEHNVSDTAHNDIRLLVQGLTERLNALADSDDTTLDQMSEVVAYIKSNKSLIDAITTSKINVSDIIDNLTTNASNKPLSAAQGVALKALIDAIAVPTKLSELENDSGYAKATDIPEKLPNPQKLTFTGAVTAEYDGSAPLSVEIPSGGGGVDSWELVNSVTTSEEVATVEISTNSSGETFSLENILVAIYVPYGASITGQVSFINQWNTFNVFGIALSTTIFNENRRNLVELRTEYFSGITFIYTRKNLGEAVSHISEKTNKYPISSVKVITSNSAMLPVGTFVGVYRK